MVTATESHTYQQISAWKPPDSHHMAHPPPEQKHRFLASDACPNLRGLSTGLENPYMKDAQCTPSHMFGLLDKPTSTYDTRKRYLIFDQSGNHTRLFVSPRVLTPSKTLATANGLREKVATEIENQFMLKPEIPEKCDRSDYDEGEMREDTEDINALLYSSSDEFTNNYDSDGDDGEVTSTVQTSLKIGGHDYKEKLLAEFLGEEVASSDDSPKRQKLSDEEYKKTPFMSAQCVYEDDVESSCAADIDWSKREKKVKIRNALKIIASMVPGLKHDNPISIIDQAISYLKSMREEAEALGPSKPESDPAT